MIIRSCLAGVIAGAALTGPAWAQGFERDRNESVAERAQARSRGQPIHAGAFNVWPELGVSTLYNDNIRATGTGEESDFIVSLNPSVLALSDWRRHELRGYAYANSRTYLDNDAESHTDWGGEGEARLDFAGPVTIGLSGGYANLHEVRTSPSSPAAAREPVVFDNASLGVSASRTFNRLLVSGGVDVAWLDFDDVLAIGGAVIDQDERDRQVVEYAARFDYAVSPSTAVFGAVSANQRDYDFSGPTSRDSEGYAAAIGAEFDVGALARGEVSLAYVDQDYDAAIYAGVSGFGVNGELETFPSPLTTVTFSGRVAAEETSLAAATGYLTQSIGVGVDHELLRTLILSGALSYTRDDYEGLDRADDRWGSSVSALYLMNRNVGLSTEYRYFRQDSSGVAAAPDFSVNVLTVNVTLRPG